MRINLEQVRRHVLAFEKRGARCSEVKYRFPTVGEGRDGTKAQSTGIGSTLGEILTPQEVAERLKVPESWVYEKIRPRCGNPLPSKRIGRYIRFNWLDVVEWFTNLPNTKATKPVKKARKIA